MKAVRKAGLWMGMLLTLTACGQTEKAITSETETKTEIEIETEVEAAGQIHPSLF